MTFWKKHHKPIRIVFIIFLFLFSVWSVGSSFISSYFFGVGAFGQAIYTDPIVHSTVTIALNLLIIMVYNMIRLLGGKKRASWSLIIGSILGILSWIIIPLFFEHLLEFGEDNVVYYDSVVWGIILSSLVGFFGFYTLRKWKKEEAHFE